MTTVRTGVSQQGPEHARRYFRTDIEGLRALAVLAVVLFHVGTPARGGYVGVDVFFVLSGYLITDLLIAELQQTGTISLRAFYGRRARRLLPAATLALIATAIAGAILLSPIEQIRYAGTAQATSSYASNLWFLLKSSDYFAPGLAGNPFLHTWSLAVEEQFYLVWPVLLLVAASRTGSTKRVMWILVALSLLSAAACIWLTGLRQMWAFYLTPIRAWEFGIGGILSLTPRQTAIRARYIAAIGIVGLTLFVGTVLSYSAKTPFPGAAAILPVCGTVLMLVPGHVGMRGALGDFLAITPLQWLGRRSYSWYLWHWPALIYALTVFPAAGVWVRLAAVGSALIVAASTFRFVERPVRDHSALKHRPGRTLALGGILTLVCLATATVWGQVARHETSTGQKKAARGAAATRSVLDTRPCFPAAIDPTPRECIIGDSSSATIVVAIGDSHLAQWYAALNALGAVRHWRIVTLIKGACPTAALPTYSKSLSRTYSECAAWRRVAITRVVGLKPAGVIIANSSVSEVAEDVVANEDDWLYGLVSTVSAWDSLGITTALIRDTPHMGVDIPVCLSRAAARPWYSAAKCEATRLAALDTTQFRAMQIATTRLHFASVVDFTDLFCNMTRCPGAPHGVIAFRDESHLSSAFAAYATPAFVSRVSTALGARSFTGAGKD